MPKATIDKDCGSVAWKNYIWGAWQGFSVKPEPETS